jgi:hypothetical protein
MASLTRYRNLCPRLRREEATAIDGQVRHRCQGCTRDKLDAIYKFLIVQERLVPLESSAEGHLPFQARVHISLKVVPIDLVVLCILHVRWSSCEDDFSLHERTPASSRSTQLRISINSQPWSALVSYQCGQVHQTRESAHGGTRNRGVASANTRLWLTHSMRRATMLPGWESMHISFAYRFI